MSHSYVINARNCNDGLADALTLLTIEGTLAQSRNGPVLRLPAPVVITYTHPTERVMFSALRDANPFFHIYECIWMLAGRNDAASVGQFAKQMLMYANEEGNFDSAYGYRWARHFKFDQLERVIKLLRADPESRRAVLAMWDAPTDLAVESKDIPCNTHVYFEIQNQKLNMTVCNRSNDAVWGAFGANYVHMSFLQEYIASSLGCAVGIYYQISNNLHVYIDRPDVKRLMDGKYQIDDRYIKYGKQAEPLAGPQTLGFNFELDFKTDCAAICNQVAVGDIDYTCATPWMQYVAVPLLRAHKAYKDKSHKASYIFASCCEDWGWRKAATEWLDRREENRLNAGAV